MRVGNTIRDSLEGRRPPYKPLAFLLAPRVTSSVMGASISNILLHFLILFLSNTWGINRVQNPQKRH
jgi:hypothetical protein